MHNAPLSNYNKGKDMTRYALVRIEGGGGGAGNGDPNLWSNCMVGACWVVSFALPIIAQASCPHESHTCTIVKMGGFVATGAYSLFAIGYLCYRYATNNESDESIAERRQRAQHLLSRP